MTTFLAKFEHVVIELAIATGLILVSAVAMVASAPKAGSTTNDMTSPVSAFFLPSGDGWIVSGNRCSTHLCITVKRTMNGGRSWSSLPLPLRLRTDASQVGTYFPLVQQNIFFANARNGWIYGSRPPAGSGAETFTVPNADIWSTHDGGETWSALNTKSLGMRFDVLALTSDRGSVYAIGWRSDRTLGLWTSSLTSDAWRRVTTPTLYAAAGGSNMQGALIFKGANGWLMVGNDRGVTGSARMSSSGQWVKWNSPCFNVGDGFSVPVASSATDLVDVCTIGGFGGNLAPGTPSFLKQQSNWVFTSHNAGVTFAPTSRVVIDGTSNGLDQLPTLPASPSPGSILVARSITQGQSMTDHLYLTRNDGKTWNSVYASPPSTFFPVIQFMAFASSSFGYAIVQTTPTTSELIVSTNGGLSWHARAT